MPKPPGAPPSDPAPGGARRRRRLAARFGLALALLGAGLVAAELGLRSILFGWLRANTQMGAGLRRAAYYTDGSHHDEFWILQALFRRAPTRGHAHHDPLLGWTGKVEPGTYAHPDEPRIGARRPILLYGDSNAQCMTVSSECFEGLLEESDLARDHVLLNYGVGGYGLDQIYLMLRATIDRLADRDPIVIVSLMIDDSLERSMLSFREWPKPRFGVRDGELIEPRPVDPDGVRFLAQHRPAIPSYLYRLAAHRLRRPPHSAERTPAEIAAGRELNRALLAAIREELERRSLRYFFFLFYYELGLERRGAGAWSEDLVLEFLRETGSPYVSMRDFLEVVFGERFEGFGGIIGRGDPVLQGHFNDAGNRLAFEAMRQGLEGRFGDFDFERVRRMAEAGVFRSSGEQVRELALLERRARVRFVGPDPCVRIEGRALGQQEIPLGLRTGPAAPTYLALDLRPSDARLLGRAAAVAVGQASCAGSELRLAVRLDDGEWHERAFPIGGPFEPLAVDLAGAARVELRLVYDGPDPECAWLALQGLRLE